MWPTVNCLLIEEPRVNAIVRDEATDYPEFCPTVGVLNRQSSPKAFEKTIKLFSIHTHSSSLSFGLKI